MLSSTTSRAAASIIRNVMNVSEENTYRPLMPIFSSDLDVSSLDIKVLMSPADLAIRTYTRLVAGSAVVWTWSLCNCGLFIRVIISSKRLIALVKRSICVLLSFDDTLLDSNKAVDIVMDRIASLAILDACNPVLKQDDIYHFDDILYPLLRSNLLVLMRNII